jgi:hypothetical protein
MTKCPFWKRKVWLRVVVKLKSESFQWCTLSTRSSLICATFVSSKRGGSAARMFGPT